MNLAGMTPTGRRVTGPGADLVELESGNGLKHTAIVFHAAWRDHPSLGAPLMRALPFLEEPGIAGIAPLVAHDPDEGAFVYATGTVVSLADVLRVFSASGVPAGVKAALELCFLTAELLVEAAEVAGGQAGLRGHGAVQPWRVALRTDGQVVLLGYGVPQPELVHASAEQLRSAREDALRYAPPERLAGEPEELSSDLFSLALVAAELVLGKPLYDGTLAEVRQQATRGEAVRRLYQVRDRMPDGLREALARALKPDVDARYRSAREFVDAIHELLAASDAEGMSLSDVAKRTLLVLKRGRAVVGGGTGDMSDEELAEFAAAVELGPTPAVTEARLRRAGAPSVPPPAAVAEPARWGKVARAPGEVTRTQELTGPAADLRERLRSSRRIEATPAAPAPAPEESARDRLRPRLKERGGDDADAVLPPVAAPPVAAPVAAPMPSALPVSRVPFASVDDLPRPSSGTPAASVATAPAAPAEVAAPPAPAPAPAIAAPITANPVVRPAPAAPAPAAEPPARHRDDPAALLARLRADAPVRPRLRAEPTRSGGAAGVSVSLLVEGVVRTVAVAPDGTVADLIGQLTLALGPPMDSLGRLEGAWRVERGGRRLPATTPLSELSLDTPLAVVCTPNEVRMVHVEVLGLADPIRFRAPMGAAVDARAIVQHLERLLGLPSAAWQVSMDGVRLDPRQTLAEAGWSEQPRVVVSR